MIVPALPAELEDLYRLHARTCLALACVLLGDAERAEAAVQAAYLDAWGHLGAGAPLPGPAGSWLTRRTHRHAVTRLRADRTGPPTPPAVPAVEDRLTALPVDQQRAVRWALWGGCTAQDIAALTGTPVREVRACMLAGVRALIRPTAT